MNVLFVSPAAELGGAERCLLDNVAALRASDPGATIDVLSLADGPLLTKARALGARTLVLGAPAELAALGESGNARSLATALRLLQATPAGLSFLFRLLAEMRRLRPDIVHTNGMKAHLLAGLVAPARSRLVVHLHDFIGARRASKRLLPALATLRPSASFVANSQAVARDFAQLAPSAEVHTIYNVVDTAFFSEGPGRPARLAELAELEPPQSGTIAFGLVATYARWKGHHLFIEAAGRLCAQFPEMPLRFYIVGGPIYQTLGSQVSASELREHAREVHIERLLGLVPFQDDVADVYRSLDVVVHASTSPEPFGRTIVEAMACARPVIVTRAGGAAELFHEGEDALGFAMGNADELVTTMARMLDAGVRARLAHAAREHAHANFGRQRLGPQLLAVYSGGARR